MFTAIMEIFALIAHLVTTLVRVALPGGVRAVIAESLLLKHQLLILNRSRNRAPRLTPWARLFFGVGAFLVSPKRLCHFPPGTSKWNKIEHRMFCHITQNWRGRPLVSHEVIIKLIGKTTTQTGLRIRAELDTGSYPTGIKISNAALAALNLEHAAFHGDWNYVLLPKQKQN